jgi:hypothetical protein
MSAWFLFGIAALTLVLSFCMALVTGVWVLGRNNTKLVIMVTKTVAEQRKEVDIRLEEIQKRFGENILAIRQKMNDMEIWGRDNFVAKQTFQLVIGEIKTLFTRIEDKLDRRMDRLEGKIDERNGDNN